LRKKFSERHNFKNPRDTFQIQHIDNELRNRLWNQIQLFYFDKLEMNGIYIKYQLDFLFFKKIYDEFLKSHEKIDTYLDGLNKDLKNEFFAFQWYEIYDFIEYISELYHNTDLNEEFKSKVNQVLEDEMSGYRFVGDFIVPIIENTEIEAIEEALECEYTGVKIHLSNSLESLSDKENPDYINSIKESISAVESAVNLVSGKKNVALNRCIQHIPFEMDRNFNSAMIKLYSWTSSADGIRHGVTEEEIKSSFAEAKFMLVTCSAFVNYLIDKQKET
jgi:hypothetical protein